MTSPASAAPSKRGPATTVTDVRRVPLEQLAEHSDALRRVLPSPQSTKAPVAAFDASL